MHANTKPEKFEKKTNQPKNLNFQQLVNFKINQRMYKWLIKSYNNHDRYIVMA